MNISYLKLRSVNGAIVAYYRVKNDKRTFSRVFEASSSIMAIMASILDGV